MEIFSAEGGRHMRRLYVCAVLLFAVFLLSFGAVSAEMRTVNIGVVKNTVPETIESRKLLRTYTKAYLDEIARKANWRYAMYELQPEDAKRMLDSGEIDFMVPVTEIEAAREDGFIFSEGFTCYGLLSLYTRVDNTVLNVDDKRTMYGCRVGMLKHGAYDIKLLYIMNKFEWEVQPVYYRDSSQMMKALREGEVDVVLDDGSHITKNERWLFDIDVVQQQFMTVPAKKELLDIVNNAILDSEILNPSFETGIEKDYLDPVQRHIVKYTEREIEYTKEAPELRVIFMPYVPPLFDLHVEREKPWGIYVDLLKAISDDTGLKFTFVEAKDEETALKMMDEGKADLLFAVYQNIKIPEGAAFTNTLRKEPFVVVVRTGMAWEGNGYGKIAVPRVFPGVIEFMENHFPNAEIVEYSMVRDCLKAVEMREVACAVVPSKLLDYYSSTALRPDIEIVPLTRVNVPVGMGISKQTPHILQSILNTAILRIPPDEVERIIEKNGEPEISFRYVVQKYPLRVTLIVAIILFFAGLGLFLVYRANEEKSKNAVLREKNRLLEDALERIRSLTVARDYYKQDAETDKLTGLLNKGAFHAAAKTVLSEMSDSDKAILFITDLDNFKGLNDTEGHQYGDEVLVAYAKVLNKVFPEAQAIGRFGGDEFMGILRNISREDFLKAIERLMLETRNITSNGKKAGITVSIGAAEAVKGHCRYNEVFEEADRALYTVKNSTRDALTFNGKMYRV